MSASQDHAEQLVKLVCHNTNDLYTAGFRASLNALLDLVRAEFLLEYTKDASHIQKIFDGSK